MAKRTKRRVKEAEAVSETADFRDVLPGILAIVANVTDMKAWRRAYPKVEFMEVDEGFSGRPIDWGERSVVEIAAYVAYMRDPQRTEVNYEILADGYRARVKIDDSERVWWIWLAGCFAGFDGESGLSESGRETLLHYAAQQAGEFEEFVKDRILPDDVELVSLEMTVKSF